MSDLREIIPSTAKRKVYAGYAVDLCPFHDDTKPSFLIYPDKYRCLACGKWGTVWDGQRGTPAAIPVVDTPVEPLPIDLAFTYSGLIGPRQFQYFHERGITDASISKFLLGYGCPPGSETPRYTVPIIEKTRLLNIKFRRDDTLETDDAVKYLGIAGHNRAHLWGISSIGGQNKCIVTAGEFDRIVAHQHLMPDIYPVTGTTGESAWNDAWTKAFAPVEKLYVCLDSDQAGQVATEKLCKRLRDSGLFPVPVILPPRYKDVTEFFLYNNRDAFLRLIPSTERVWFLV